MSSRLNQLLWAVRGFERHRQWALEERRAGDHSQARVYAAEARQYWSEIKSLTPLINQALQA